MAITDSQKTDLLFKKVGYGVAKTDVSTNKSPSNESSASPLVSPGSTIYQQDYAISSVTVLPTSNSSVVSVYRDTLTSTVQCTKLPTTSANVSWSTGLTDWIPVQYGTGYQVKLYAAAPGTPAPQTTGISLPADGSGNNDSWYFDYQSGIVNFADTNVPTAANQNGNVVYAVGARYTGVKGITTFPNVTVTGNVVTGNVVTGNVYVSGLIYGNVSGNISGAITGNITGNITGTVLTSYQPYITSVGTLSNLTVSGNTFVSNVYTTGSYFGNIVTDTITPYQTNVVVFTNNTAVKLPSGSTSARPNGIAGFFRYNSDIATIEFFNGVSWIPFNNAIIDQQITPDGVSQNYTLSQASTAAALIVSINGTMQLPGVAYTVSGTTLTFSEAPKITDIVDVRFIASAGTTTLDYNIVDVSNVAVGTSNVIIDSFNSGVYRSAKYVISSANGTDASMAQVMLIQNAGTAVVSVVGNVNTGSNYLTFYANTSGPTVNFIAQGSNPSNQVRVQRTYFNV